jgi:hypothetical protein
MKAILDRIEKEKYLAIVLTENEASRLLSKKLLCGYAMLEKKKYNISIRLFMPDELRRELNAID